MDKKLYKKLKKLNYKLFKLEQTITSEAIKFDEVLQKRIKNKKDSLFDYEMEVEVEFYKNDKLITTINESLKGISNDSYHFFKNIVNHNEFLFKKHKMRDDYHCYLFHSLYDHKNLSFKQIAKIDTFWADIKVFYQFKEKV